MSITTTTALSQRERELFAHDLHAVHARTDRLFGWLLIAQWAAGIACALTLTPLAWEGTRSSVHPHVWAAVLLGGLITSLPFALARLMPGRIVTRHAIAAAQVLWSALLIDLTGGRLETHFHVFGSLAFIAFYRDWRVLMTATVVVAADHCLRGWLWPRSVFGPGAVVSWRWLEHAGWVLFEDAFLIPACLRGMAEMRTIAARQAAVEAAQAGTEQEVRERTRELTAANESLAKNQADLRTAYDDLQTATNEHKVLHEKLVAASRMAGMAEVATGVLHNVGNVLNSVNVSAQVIADRLRRSEVPTLGKAADLIRDHRADLPAFLERDQRGRAVPAFLIEVARCLAAEQAALEAEVQSILTGVEHVKQVVAMQQENAKHKSLLEAVRPADIAEAALKLQQESLARHGITVVKQLEDLPPITIDRHRVLQVLVNLITNARQAMADSPRKEIIVTVATRSLGGAPHACIEVSDTGTGIPQENLARIFQHGFTTKQDGHGFGLHSAAIAAQAMGGALHAASEGPGRGATFTLLLPWAARSAASDRPATQSIKTESPCTAS